AGASRARPGRPAYHAGRDHGGRAKALRGSDACARRRRAAADGESAGGATYAARTSAAGHSRRDRLTPQWSLTRACDADRVALSFPRRPGGGMADAGDLKSSGREAVWVRPPPRVSSSDDALEFAHNVSTRRGLSLPCAVRYYARRRVNRHRKTTEPSTRRHAARRGTREYWGESGACRTETSFSEPVS